MESPASIYIKVCRKCGERVRVNSDNGICGFCLEKLWQQAAAEVGHLPDDRYARYFHLLATIPKAPP